MNRYFIEIEIYYPKNSKGNPHVFEKFITHKFWDCDFWIVNKSLVITKDGSTHEYDLNNVKELKIIQLI